ncbi:MAG: argininosuccinate lyase, partial [Calditrichaeota bacterium]|nr:argininosuccinate lyase [Calditrichota bacterium]
KIHTGRSRNDQVMTDVFLYLKEKNQEAGKWIRQLQEVVVTRAENHRTTVLPGLTHLQQAQPILLSHYLLSIFWALQRTAERLSENLARLDVLPLGSGALAGSAFPLDRRFLARELGFGKISANSLDAVSHRDVMTEFAGILTQLSVTLSRYAEDFILWSTREFGFLTLSDAYSTGSSMMPQKKNPDSLELIRGKAATNIGHFTALLSLEKGLPLTYNRDLQEDKIHLFGILDNALPTLRIFRGLLKTAVFNAEAMRSVVHPFTLATDLADYLTEKGLPFREAHRVIGTLVHNCVESGKNLTDLSLEDFRSYSPLFEKDVFDWLTIGHSLERRNLPGGTGPQAVDAALREAKKLLNHKTEEQKNQND